jgi:cytochrome c oxidase assembly protein Cox11
VFSWNSIAIVLLLSQFAFGSDNIASMDKKIFSILFLVLILLIMLFSFGCAFIEAYKNIVQQQSFGNTLQKSHNDTQKMKETNSEDCDMQVRPGVVRVVSSSIMRS